jgi:tRNA-dihydrouridine synthase
MVKQAVAIPIFGNGNVFADTDCLKMIETTGCDGVAVGRMALARPWLFAEWTDGFQCESDIFLKSAIHLARLLEQHFDREKALRRFKRFGFYFAANFKFGHTLFTGIQNVQTMKAAEAFLYRFFKLPPEVVSRPNLNFFS